MQIFENSLFINMYLYKVSKVLVDITDLEKTKKQKIRWKETKSA